MAGIRSVLSFFGLAFDRIVLEVYVKLQTVVKVELERRSAELLRCRALLMLLGLLLVGVLQISKVLVDVALGEVIVWARLFEKLGDVGFVHRACGRAFDFKSSAPV